LISISARFTSHSLRQQATFDIHLSFELFYFILFFLAMFNARITLLVPLAMSFVGQVSATPLPMLISHALDTRETPFDVIPAYIRRDINTAYGNRQNINSRRAPDHGASCHPQAIQQQETSEQY